MHGCWWTCAGVSLTHAVTAEPLGAGPQPLLGGWMVLSTFQAAVLVCSRRSTGGQFHWLRLLPIAVLSTSFHFCQRTSICEGTSLWLQFAFIFLLKRSEPLLLCLPVLWVSSFVDCLFKPLPIFPHWSCFSTCRSSSAVLELVLCC